MLNVSTIIILIIKIMFDYNQLSTMSLAELRQLNNTIVTLIKAKRKVDSVIKKQRISIGDVVSLTSPKYAGKTFTIVKVNRTKAVITDVQGYRYDCPISLIKV